MRYSSAKLKCNSTGKELVGNIVKRDIKSLCKFKTSAAESLAAKMEITTNDAESFMRLLEAEDMIRFEAPEYIDKPAMAYTLDNQLDRDNLSMTSHKAGNLIINTYLDWKTTVGFATASVETITGLASQNPFLVVAGIVSWLLSLSSLIDVKIGENGTAIILALQQHKRHKEYITTEQQCRQEANEILVSHGYEEMNDETFGKEIAKLYKIKCVDFLDESRLKLLEKVILPF